MKKIIITIILVVAVLATGCSYDMSDQTRKKFEKDAMAASVALYNNEVVDPDAMLAETKLVAYTIEDQVQYTVSFAFVQDDGQVFFTDDIVSREDIKSDKEWRDWVKSAYITTLLKMFESNKVSSGKFAGIILKWTDRNFFGTTEQNPTLIDFDGDGTWDYVTDSHVCYFSETEASGYPKNDSGITLVSLAELYPLEGLTGNETLSDFEDILKNRKSKEVATMEM